MKRLLAYASIASCIVLFVIYSMRPDWAAALTIFPAWLWLAGWLLALPALRSRLFVWCSILWLCFVVVQVEESQSMLRCLLPVEQVEDSLRITTVNSSGLIVSIRDALIDQPDVLLIQESPGKDDLSDLLEEQVGYQLLYGADTSIIVRGEIEGSYEKQFYIMGAAVIDERKYTIVSLRLLTSKPRIDLWNIYCWKAQIYMRQRQIEQINEIVDLLPDDSTLIVGGDFNVPQGDRVYSQMSDRLIDSFEDGGRGWCNTILVDYPMLRIDQIWTSQDLSCYNANVRSSPKTDHLLYTAEFKP
jgi:endonuclease/exonuclease/phosphatase (EEP) superfamily protein YafD